MPVRGIDEGEAACGHYAGRILEIYNRVVWPPLDVGDYGFLQDEASWALNSLYYVSYFYLGCILLQFLSPRWSWQF